MVSLATNMACQGCDWCQEITIFQSMRRFRNMLMFNFMRKIFQKVDSHLFPVKAFIYRLQDQREEMKLERQNPTGVRFIMPDEQLLILFFGKVPEDLNELMNSGSRDGIGIDDLSESIHQPESTAEAEINQEPSSVAMDTTSISWQLAQQWTRNHMRPLLRDEHNRQKWAREKFASSWIFQRIAKREKIGRFPEYN